MTNLEKLTLAFATALELDVSQINNSLTYDDSHQWDSTAHMILIAHLESDFDVMFEIDDIIDMNSFEKAQALLMKYCDGLSFE